MPTSRPSHLRAAAALSPAELRALSELERLCVEHDGCRLKLEFPTLKARRGNRPSDFTWWEEGDLVGFAGVYQWRREEAEVTGMVHPDHRRQGIFGHLVGEAMAELHRRAAARVLLVTDRGSEGGQGFVRSIGAVYEHSEHRMVQTHPPAGIAPDPLLRVRPAGLPGDATFIAGALAAAFGTPAPDVVLDEGWDGSDRYLVVERDGELVGTLRVSRQEDRGVSSAGIYGFGIVPERQGRGIGRRVLADVVTSLRDEGVERITLEVAVNNDAALKVYESCGFERVGTDDYFLVETGSDAAGGSLHPAGGR